MKNYKKLQSSKELMKLLNFHGWKVVAVKGSHYQFKHHEIKGRVTLTSSKKFADWHFKKCFKTSKNQN